MNALINVLVLYSSHARLSEYALIPNKLQIKAKKSFEIMIICKKRNFVKKVIFYSSLTSFVNEIQFHSLGISNGKV